MQLEASTIINCNKSYFYIQLSEIEIEELTKGGLIGREITFLDTGKLYICVGDESSTYPLGWPDPNIKSTTNTECPIPGCPEDKAK